MKEFWEQLKKHINRDFVIDIIWWLMIFVGFVFAAVMALDYLVRHT